MKDREEMKKRLLAPLPGNVQKKLDNLKKPANNDGANPIVTKKADVKPIERKPEE